MDSAIRRLRNSRGLTQQGLADRIKRDKSTVWRYEAGRTPIFNDGALEVFQALGLTTQDEILRALSSAEAPMIGAVGAGARIFPAEDDAETIPSPPGLDQPIAVRVSGTSMMPAYRPGDILFCENRPVTSQDIMNRDCIVETMDGRRLVKKVLPGGAPGTVRLFSYETQEAEPDVQLRTASVVRWVQRA